MKKIKKAQKGGCLSTTGSGTRTSIYKQAAGEGRSGADGKAARQFARNERRMDKAAAKMEREEAKAAAKAPKSKYGSKVKKAQKGVTLTEMGKKTTKAAVKKRTDDMAKSLDKASVFGKNYIAPSDSVSKARPKGMNFDKKSFDKLPSLDKLKKKSAPKKEMKYGGKAKKMMSGGKCKYGC